MQKNVGLLTCLLFFICATTSSAFDSKWLHYATKAGNALSATSVPALAIVGNIPGGYERSSKTGEPFVVGFGKQALENGVAKRFTAVGSGLAGALGSGFFGKKAAGMILGSDGRSIAKAFIDSSGNNSAATIGGLQASLSDTKSLTNVTNGIQQYNLLGAKFSSEPTQRVKRNKGNNNFGGDPGRVLIGRLPPNKGERILDDIGQGIIDGLVGGILGAGSSNTGGRGGNCSFDYTVRNPCAD